MPTRHEMLRLLTDYTAAVTENDPDALPLATTVRVTSNGEPVRPGAGAVWGGPRRIVFRLPFVDVRTSTAILMSTVTKAVKAGPDAWWFYCVRIHLGDGGIDEIEEVAYDGTMMGFHPSSLELPDRIWDTVVPDQERTTSDEMVRIADCYFDAVSGLVDAREVPFAPDCRRRELGAFTTDSLLTPGSARTGLFDETFRWDVVDRRYFVLDEDRGVVIAVANFKTPKSLPDNNGSVVFEAFKIQDRLIRHIEAMFRNNGQPRSGWESTVST